MTTTEYLQREIRRAELSIRQAHRKPNTPLEEIEGLCEKLKHMQEAIEAVNEHWQRVHEQRGWTAGEPLTREQHADVRPAVRGRWRWVGQDQWNDCYECSQCGKMNTDNSNFCPNCGADMRGGDEL